MYVANFPRVYGTTAGLCDASEVAGRVLAFCRETAPGHFRFPLMQDQRACSGELGGFLITLGLFCTAVTRLWKTPLRASFAAVLNG